jgi:glycosyltransferase involved in cell wall biosynthesis
MDFVMDNELIEEVARRRPDWHWVFIGTKTNHVRVSAPNIHFLGPKSYSELPSYMSHVDVFVLPWRQDCAFTSYGSAIKVKEYLATGKPVVISPLYEYLETPGIRIYHSVDEFVAGVEDSLQETDKRLAAERQSVVRQCTWDLRAKQLGNAINDLVHGGRYIAASSRIVFKGSSGAG